MDRDALQREVLAHAAECGAPTTAREVSAAVTAVPAALRLRKRLRVYRVARVAEVLAALQPQGAA